MNFTQIVTKQYELNDLFSKKTWITDSRVSLLDAIADEARELAVSAGWAPWWKGGAQPEYDEANCQVEVIDIMHFHIGEAIKETQYDLVSNAGEFRDNVDETNAHVFAREFASIEAFDTAWNSGEDFTLQTENEREFAISEVASAMESSVDHASAKAATTTKERRDAIHAYTGAVNTYGAMDSFVNLFELAQAFNMTPEMMFWMYQAKHALNTFRKTNNYDGKDTTRPRYSKIWDGREDNYHVMAFVREQIANGNALTTESIVAAIGEMYVEFNGR